MSDDVSQLALFPEHLGAEKAESIEISQAWSIKHHWAIAISNSAHKHAQVSPERVEQASDAHILHRLPHNHCETGLHYLIFFRFIRGWTLMLEGSCTCARLCAHVLTWSRPLLGAGHF